MGGGGGPNPKGKKIDQATVISTTDDTVTFKMKPEDVTYFVKDDSYQLIAVDKEKD